MCVKNSDVIKAINYLTKRYACKNTTRIKVLSYINARKCTVIPVIKKLKITPNVTKPQHIWRVKPIVLTYDETHIPKFGAFIIKLTVTFVPSAHRVMRVMHASRTSCVKDFDLGVVLLRLRRDRSRLNAKHVEEKNRPREKERKGTMRQLNQHVSKLRSKR